VTAWLFALPAVAVVLARAHVLVHRRGRGAVRLLVAVDGGLLAGSATSATLAAMSERLELFGRATVIVGLAEWIAIYRLIVAVMLMGRA
jgi:V/A-type H+/Na+-transporting ATPase subunit K